MKTGLQLIYEERQRQLIDEGWTHEHDAYHTNDELAVAAAMYALPDFNRIRISEHHKVPVLWPFQDSYWKPTPEDRVRELVKAGALIAAEIDRLQNNKP